MNREDQRNRGQRAFPGVGGELSVLRGEWAEGFRLRGPCLQLCPPGFRCWLSKQRNIRNTQESMRVPAAVFSPYKRKKRRNLKYFQDKAKGRRWSTGPQSRLGRVSQNECSLQGPARWQTGQAGDRELSWAVRSFSETAIHVTLIAQSIIRCIYLCPWDMSPACLCLVFSKNK